MSASYSRTVVDREFAVRPSGGRDVTVLYSAVIAAIDRARRRKVVLNLWYDDWYDVVGDAVPNIGDAYTFGDRHVFATETVEHHNVGVAVRMNTGGHVLPRNCMISLDESFMCARMLDRDDGDIRVQLSGELLQRATQTVVDETIRRLVRETGCFVVYADGVMSFSRP